MTTAAGRCEEIDSVEKSRIYCPVCCKDYAILKLTHLCSIVPCGRNGRVKYEERYYTQNLETPAETQLMCNNCETEHKKHTAPRKGMCPECKYVGWYVQDDTGICPACIAKKITAIAAEHTQPSPGNSSMTSPHIRFTVDSASAAPVNAPPAPLPTLYINFITSDSADTPAQEFPDMITITGYVEGARPPVMLTVRQTWGTAAPRRAASMIIATPPVCPRAIGKYLTELTEKYSLQCVIDRSIDRLWLRWLCREYTADFPAIYV
jgi:hypothetical protein